MSVIETQDTRTLPMRRARTGAALIRSHRTGFWLVGYAFAAVMGFAALPTPLYALYAQRDHLSTTLLAVVFATYAVGVVISLLTVAHLSDRVGRRPMLLAGLVLALGAGGVFISGTSLAGLLVARLLSGLAVGVVTTTATAQLGELNALHPGTAARRAQVVAVAANLGGIGLGPLIAGLLAQYAPNPLLTPYLVTEVMLVVATGALARTPETVRRVGSVPHRMPRIAVPRPVRATFAAAALGAAITFTILGIFSALVPGFLADSLHQPSRAVAGAVPSIVFVASAVTQVIDRGAARRPLRTGVVVAGLGLSALTVATWTGQLAVFVAGAVVTGVAVGLIFKAMLSIVVNVAPPGQRGEVLASFFLSAYVGLAVPVVAFGVLADFVSPPVLMTGFALVAVAGLTIAARGLHSWATSQEALS
jgi:MFS family permease